MSYSKKSLGQNYLIDSNIIKKITNIPQIYNKNILEIGPGMGALTEQILSKKPKSLILVEKDDFLSEELKKKYKKYDNITVFNQDILKFDLEKKMKKDTIIIGNLPYNIASQILVKIIKSKKWPPKYFSLILMFQKEMSDRITGSYGTSNYGRLSILANYRLDIISKFNVSPNCFSPKPKVDSTVIFFKPKNEILCKLKSVESLEKITNIFFSSKRKMINKNIKKIFKEEDLQELKNQINLKARPTDIKPDLYYNLARIFEKIN